MWSPLFQFRQSVYDGNFIWIAAFVYYYVFYFFHGAIVID